LEILLNKAGFVINKISEDFIPKEITLIASVKEEISLKDIDISLGMDLVNGYYLNLDEIFKQAKLLSGNFGVFGTSISATWLASEFLERVDFFVDEDINRIGGNYMGKPVYGIENCPSNTNVLMPLRYDIASKVIDRLRDSCKINFIIPPKTKYNGK